MTFDIDANGILNVTARDKDTNAERSITISEIHPLQQRGGADGRRGRNALPRRGTAARGRLPQRIRFCRNIVVLRSQLAAV
ncbi:Hsp70 family protein [Mycolicibacterium vulneris]|uniref:Hsp70 family protein n=1 Tax=Mycolicibacterium vulneris TaxID=547163 RepID=UPI001FE8D77A|nr:Hsp70 family protein [Mycolicibacterium vulneris]